MACVLRARAPARVLFRNHLTRRVGRCSIAPMTNTSDLDADRAFVRIWTEARDLAEVARALGLSRSATSTRATRLRARGVDLPRFSAGRKARQLPVALQARRWAWSRVKRGRVEHRSVSPGRAICGADLAGCTVVSQGVRPCHECWPVESHPPRTGPIPDDLEWVVILTSSTSAELAHRFDGQLVDVETGEPIPVEMLTNNLGWWAA